MTTMPIDKSAHFAAGAALTLAVGYYAPVWAALAVGVIAGALKEWYDSFHPDKHTVDIADFWAMAVGAVAGALVIFFGMQ